MLQAARKYIFVGWFFAVDIMFGKCFKNLAALRVKLEPSSNFQINFDFINQFIFGHQKYICFSVTFLV